MIASGKKVILRDRIPADVDRWLYWRTHGAWRKLDAPWEGVHDYVSAEKKAELRERFLEMCAKEPPALRGLAADPEESELARAAAREAIVKLDDARKGR